MLFVSSCKTKTGSESLKVSHDTKTGQASVVQRVAQEKDEKVIRFAYNSSKIDQDSANYLDKKVVAWLKDSSSVNIVIQGHCDERGSNKYNYNLGKKRANSVMNYLVNKGILKSRMKAISYGKTRPIAFGHNEEAWSLNRRAVVISVR